MYKIISIIGIPLSLGLGIWVGGVFMQRPADISLASIGGEIRDGKSAYQFINPLLDCDLGQEYISKDKPRPSRTKIEDLIVDLTKDKKISFASVYYRDLNNGPWIGIHEDEKFYPASLMKVPIMMSYFKAEEEDPGIFEKKIKFDKKNAPFEQFYKPSQRIDEGTEYTVYELVERAIRYSDNDAAELLARAAGDNRLNDLMDHLRLEKPTSGEYFISVKDYGAFFRVLFNSSFLSNTMSERALKLLSTVENNYGITAELPRGVVVAHKFGERSSELTNEKQLHDCGIVYYPKNPYLLCIMTRGNDFAKMAEAIAEISKFIYNEVHAQQES